MSNEERRKHYANLLREKLNLCDLLSKDSSLASIALKDGIKEIDEKLEYLRDAMQIQAALDQFDNDAKGVVSTAVIDGNN